MYSYLAVGSFIGPISYIDIRLKHMQSDEFELYFKICIYSVEAEQ